jgi:hypothetical protein
MPNCWSVGTTGPSFTPTFMITKKKNCGRPDSMHSVSVEAESNMILQRTTSRFVATTCVANTRLCHFIKLPFHHFAISTTCRFITLPFHHFAISSLCHFITLPFHHFAISSTCHFIALTFHQLAILSIRHFIQWSLIGHFITRIFANNHPKRLSDLALDPLLK